MESEFGRVMARDVINSPQWIVIDAGDNCRGAHSINLGPDRPDRAGLSCPAGGKGTIHQCRWAYRIVMNQFSELQEEKKKK